MLSKPQLRALRIAIASTAPRRNLFRESRVVTVKEQARFLLSRKSREEWLLSRYTGGDPTIEALLRIVAR